MKKVLSIDGGGIRGIIPAMVLAEIERRTGKLTSEVFDLVAGTSTGGILALGLTKPGQGGKAQYSAETLIELYETEGGKIFDLSGADLLRASSARVGTVWRTRLYRRRGPLQQPGLMRLRGGNKDLPRGGHPGGLARHRRADPRDALRGGQGMGARAVGPADPERRLRRCVRHGGLPTSRATPFRGR
jgi:hypothetical protein